MNVLKSTAAHHSATEAMLPIIDHSSAVLLPCASDIRPIMGEAMAWQSEKREPIAPPSRTISYLSLIGLAKLFL
jgi:hypothetical protein